MLAVLKFFLFCLEGSACSKFAFFHDQDRLLILAKTKPCPQPHTEPQS